MRTPSVALWHVMASLLPTCQASRFSSIRTTFGGVGFDLRLASSAKERPGGREFIPAAHESQLVETQASAERIYHPIIPYLHPLH